MKLGRADCDVMRLKDPTLDTVICCRSEASARLVVVIALLATAVVALAAAVAVLTTVSEF